MNSDLPWDLFRTLHAVMEEGSLSGAARRLGLTQPTVARHIDALEEAVGTDLFIRSQRGLVPTETALGMAPELKTLVSTTAALMRIASSRPEEIRGSVRISASEVVGAEHLPTILTRLRQRHPGLIVELTLSNAVDDLLRREADIAVRQTEPTQSALVVRRLPPLWLGLHAHRDYLERRGTPTCLSDLANHDLIGFDLETPAIRAARKHFPTFARAAFALRTDSDLAQLAAIRAGFGIGVCQVEVAHRDPNLVHVLAGEVAIKLGLWIAMHEDLRTTARCRAVFDALVEGLGTL